MAGSLGTENQNKSLIDTLVEGVMQIILFVRHRGKKYLLGHIDCFKKYKYREEFNLLNNCVTFIAWLYIHGGMFGIRFKLKIAVYTQNCEKY